MTVPQNQELSSGSLASRQRVSRYPSYGEERIDLPRVIQPYLRRVWMIVSLIAVGAILATVLAFRMPNVYTATSTLHVAKQASKILTIEGVGQQDRTDDQVLLNTVAQSVTHASVLRRVLLATKLQQDSRFFSRSETNLAESELLERLRGFVKVQIRPKTLLVDVSATTTNAALSTLLANAVAREYVAYRNASLVTTSESGSSTLVEELKRLEIKLRDSEGRLLTFRQKHKMSSLDAERTSLDQFGTKIKTDLLAVRDQLESFSATRRLVADAKNRPSDLLSIPAIAKTPAVVEASKRLAQHHLLLAGYTNRYRSEYPKFIEARSLLGGLEVSLDQEVSSAILAVERNIPVLESSERALTSELAKVQARVQELNQLSAEYLILEREVTTDTALQQSVVKRVRELELTKQVDDAPVSVSEVAPEPRNPSGPQRVRLVAFGTLAGLFLAIGLVYLMDSLDSSIRTVDEAEEILQMPVLGAISIDDGSKGLEIPRLVMVDEAHGMTAEGFRSLRTNTEMTGRADTLRIRLVTSAFPGEGKSFCAINYAAALAQLGKRVVIVDLDLRRPTVGTRLGKNLDDPGVSSFLLGQKTYDEIIQETRVPGLSVITAGPRVPNPAEQLGGPHLGELFEGLQTRFDVIVVDTPPVNSVSDSITTLNHVNLVLLVIKAGKTSERAVKRAISEIQRSGSRVDGMVLNQLPKHGGYGYYYYYYSKDGYKSSGVYGAPAKGA